MSNSIEVASAPTPQPPPETRPTAIAHVLVCLDRSALSDGCLPYAGFAAAAFGAKVTLLHVLASPMAMHEPRRVDALDSEIAKREAEHYLTESLRSLGSVRDGSVSRVAQGSPAEQIAAVARETEADLTILSSRGEGGSATLGSIAQHVLSLATGSVLLVKTRTTAPIPPSRILVPLDGSVRGECVLPMVVAMARLHGAEVLLVHVVAEPTATAVLSSPEDLRLAASLATRVQHNAESYLSRVRTRLLAEIPTVKTLVVRRPEERQAILDLAREQRADMLVLTAHGSTCNTERAFGSVTSFLLSHAQLPVFVVQDVPRHPVPSPIAELPRLPLSSRPPEVD